LGVDLEVASGSLQLPAEGGATLQVAPVSGANVVASVTRDGVAWSYSYLNLRPASAPGQYLYDRLTVDGPNGYHQLYNMTNYQSRNVFASTTDSIGRTTTYAYDEDYRPTRVTLPEGNQVEIGYDQRGNINWRRTRAKPGSPPLADIYEEASFPTDTCLNGGHPVLCWRPTWSRDTLNRQTDYLYNNEGQLIEQTDPADANGVRRKTYIAYETSTGLSRRSVVRICGDTTTCGTNAEIRTEYEYWGNTFLPSVERRIDAAAGVTLTTTYDYDAAGRLRSTDGPLAGVALALVRYFCIGETVAVPMFRMLRARATQPMCREVLDIVLRDEARHRQFGWDGLDWLLDAHGPRVAPAIEAALPGMLAEVGAAYGAGAQGAATMLPAVEAWGLAPISAYAATVTRALTADVGPRLQTRGLPFRESG